MADPKTIPHSLHRAATWYPDTDAFIQGFGDTDQRYTYEEALESVNRVANGLLELGIRNGDRVALLTDSTVEHAVTHYACTTIGAIPAGLHAREAPNTIAAMINRVRASTLVFDPKYTETLTTIRDDLDHTESYIGLDQRGPTPSFAHKLTSLTDHSNTALPDARVTRDDVAFINFSSGTTGLPKPLVTRHGQIIDMIHITAGGKDETHRILNAFAPSFMGWENVTLTNTAVAATTVFLDTDIERVPELIEHEQLTRVSLVTTPWRIIYRSGTLEEYDLSSIESAGISGETVPPALYWSLTELVTENIGTGYGLTETMGSGTSLPAHQITDETIRSVGKPKLSCEIRIIEPDSKDPDATLNAGDVGEIIITGPSICNQVWEDPTTTEEIFHPDGWVFTGDRGYIGEDGFLYLQGRTDHMIISGGINVYPEQVETILTDHPDIAECAVIGVPHEKWGETVKAYISPSNPELTPQALEDWCRTNPEMADYQRPREYEFVDSMPRNAVGKLDRNALRNHEP